MDPSSAAVDASANKKLISSFGACGGACALYVAQAVCGRARPRKRLPTSPVTRGQITNDRIADTARTRGSTQFDLPAAYPLDSSYIVTSRFPAPCTRSASTHEQPASQPDRKKARRAWTGACRTCGARFSGDGAWNTRAAHERACGQSIAPIPVTREASDEVPYRDPASPQSLVRRASLSKRPDAEETPAPRVSGRKTRPVVELYNPLLEAARPQWGGLEPPRSPAPRQSLGVKSPVQYAPDDRKFEPIDPAQIPDVGATLEDDALLYEKLWRPSGDPGADLALLRERVVPQHTDEPIQSEHPDADNAVNPMPREARALAALNESSRDPDQAKLLLERRDAAFRTAKIGPGPSACDALLVEHGGDVQYAARLYAPEKRSGDARRFASSVVRPAARPGQFVGR